MSDEVRKQTLNYFIPAQVMGKSGCIVKMYTAHGPVVHPVVKLYEGGPLSDPTEDDLLNLPAKLLEQIQAAGTEHKQGDLQREDVPSDKLHPIEPALDVYIKVNEDGSQTKRVHWEKTLELWAGKASSASVAGGEQRVYAGLQADDENVLGLVAEEVKKVTWAALNVTRQIYEEAKESEDGASYNLPREEVFSKVFFQINRLFRDVRGSVTIPADVALQEVGAINYDIIRDGDIGTFAEDLAAGHFAIVNANAARKMIGHLGIRITEAHKEDPELRIDVAKKVWLYADLLTRWEKSQEEAKELAMHEGIPW